MAKNPTKSEKVLNQKESSADNRAKALDAALSQIDRQFGKGSVMRLGDQVTPKVQVIPTGSVALDVALGIGGLPRGRVIEVYGPESSGKTTVALHAVANAQKNGGVAGFIDAGARAGPGVCAQARSGYGFPHCVAARYR